MYIILHTSVHPVLQLASDWREFRAQLVALEHVSSAGGAAALLSSPNTRWAHEIAKPEKGCLLVAKPRDLGQFTSGVVLVTEHGEYQCGKLIKAAGYPHLLAWLGLLQLSLSFHSLSSCLLRSVAG